MRIIGGQFGGRKFNPPAHIPARPTTDLAKEGLFNTLNNLIDFEGLTTLDLFGGTGNISFELASRGAKELTLVEKDRKSIKFIQEEASRLGIAGKFKTVSMDVFKFLEQCTDRFQFIFADPPYALKGVENIPTLIFEKKLLLPDGFLVLEHTAAYNFEQNLQFKKQKKYGMTLFSFFKVREMSDEN